MSTIQKFYGQEKKLSIIIPVYNEQESILPMVLAVHDALKGTKISYEVLFINDGSTDNSKEIFNLHGIQFLSHDENRGYGASIKTGVGAAKGEYICIIDCDGTYPAKEIPGLMKYVGEAQMVVGARDIYQNRWLYYLAKRLSGFLLGVLFNRPIPDINSGLRIIRRDLFCQLLPLLGNRFSITSSLTYAFLLQGWNIKFCPVFYRPRIGTSKIKTIPFIKDFFRSMLRVRRKYSELEKNCPSPESVSKSAGYGWIDKFLIGIIFLFGISVGVATLWQQLTNPYLINDDVRQHTYWMNQLHDGTLFPNDLFTEYSQFLSPAGFQGIYYILTFFAGPIEIGKILSILLFALTGVLCYLIGRTYHNWQSGLLAAFFFVAVPVFIDRFSGGLQRAFLFPLIFLFMWIITTNRYRFLGWVLSIQMLVYPVSAVISTTTLIVNGLIRPRFWRDMFKTKGAKIGLLFFGLTLCFTIVQKNIFRPEFLGPLVTKSAMFSDPAFYEGGRSPYLPFSPISYFFEKELFRRNYFFSILIILAPFFFVFQWIRGITVYRIISPILALAIASISLFEAAKIFLFRLYIPDRYLTYSLIVLGTLLAAIGASFILMLFRKRLSKSIVLAILLVFGLISNIQQDKFRRPLIMINATHRAGLLQFIATLPKDTLIASDPYLSDDIRTFSQRKTLLSYELAHPWFTHYREKVEQRIKDFYSAYFSETLENLQQLKKTYGVDYIVCRKWTLEAKNWQYTRFFTEPLNQTLHDQLASEDPENFILPRLDRSFRRYEDREFFIIQLDEAL